MARLTGSRVRWIQLLTLALCIASFGQARAVTLYFASPDSAGGLLNSDGNPVIVASPGDYVTLTVWARPDGDDGKSIVSLGHSVIIAGGAGAYITATKYTLLNPSVGGSGRRWTGVRLAGGLNIDGALIADQRAVFIPTELPFAGGIGSASSLDDPGWDTITGAVEIGTLGLAISETAPFGTSAELRFMVGPLKIANARYDEVPKQIESLHFGFIDGIPEAASADGSSVGATSLVADIIILLALRSDLDRDGDVDLVDYLNFVECLAGPNSESASPECPNSDVADVDRDGDVDLKDFFVFCIDFSS